MGPLRAAVAATVAAAASAPLLILPGVCLWPAVTPKALLHLACGALAAALLAVLLVRGDVRWRWTPIAVATAALLLVSGVSAAAGVDPHRSLWGSGERMLGVAGAAAAACLYAASATCLEGRAAWRRLVGLACAVGCVVAAIGVAQYLGAQWLRPESEGRAPSTLGHASYVGALGLFLVFAPWLVVEGTDGRRRIAFAAFSTASGLAAVAASEARAALAGLVAGGLAFALAHAVSADSARVRRGAVAAAAALAAAALAAFLLRGSPAFEGLPVLGRLGHLTGTTGATRLTAWGIAFESARERPLLGWGPSNFSHAFDAHYEPRMANWGLAETWFDNAHGAPFETLATTGFAGFAAWLALQGAVFLTIWHARSRGGISRGAACAATGLLLARLGNGMFAFDDVTAVIGGALFLGFLDAGLRAAPADPARVRATVRTVIAAGAAAGALAAAFLHTVVVRAFLGSRHAREAVALAGSDPAAAGESARRAAAIRHPWSRDERAAVASVVAATLPRASGEAPAADLDRLARFAWESSAACVERDPVDVRAAMSRATLVRRSTLREDDAARRAAVDELRRALERTPRRQSVALLLAEAEIAVGDADRAIARVRDVIDEDPEVGAGWACLAAILRAAGRDAEARAVLVEAADADAVFSDEDREILGDLLPR